MAYDYSAKVMELFRRPHNMGEIKDPDGVGKIGNPVCGDVMVMYIKVGRNGKGEEMIQDVKVKTFGCVAAISTSSILTDMIKGKTLEQALSITKDQVVKELGGLPQVKYHCSVLAVDALKKAVEDYREKKK